jgi:hypothetical protein
MARADQRDRARARDSSDRREARGRGRGRRGLTAFVGSSSKIQILLLEFLVAVL